MLAVLVFAIEFLIHFIFLNAENCTHPAKGSPYFPSNFSFGATTASYQIEGAWNTDGKGSSIWDDFTHNHAELIDDESNGDIAADSYHRFELDLQALKELKVNHYRFSISWSRIFPTGDISSRNQKGIDYYNNVINRLLENGIEPMVTMYHFDLPSNIQDLGGFTNSIVIKKFVEYAEELFKNYGDRVKKWITLNEPYMYCFLGYGDGTFPPKIISPGVGDYLCLDNSLRAHAAAYRLYKSKFFDNQGGKVGISLNSRYFFPKTNDSDIFERSMQFNLGFLAHPIFSNTGGYPEVVVNDIKRNSFNEGRITSRLPNLDGKWKMLVKGSSDFLGLNYYTSRLVQRTREPVGKNPSFARDWDCEMSIDSKWVMGTSPNLPCVPQGLENLLKYIRNKYNNVEVIITENGWPDRGGLMDDERVHFLKSHLQAVLNAINDGCNVTGYTIWSLIDNFEWLSGYREKFGLYSVDMRSPERERTAKKSANYYKNVIKTKTVSIDN